MLSLGSIALEKTSRSAMKMLRQLYGEVPVVRQAALICRSYEGATLKADLLVSAKSSDDCSPGLHFEWKLTGDS